VGDGGRESGWEEDREGKEEENWDKIDENEYIFEGYNRLKNLMIRGDIVIKGAGIRGFVVGKKYLAVMEIVDL
ncbi:hypothetical protein, partial [Paenibacillus xylanexedens]|uniref:hypothetical protein n=1 Tax=Paenibacillus xylanexedens TaxID=528191 RepID=UPI001642B820